MGKATQGIDAHLLPFRLVSCYCLRCFSRSNHPMSIEHSPPSASLKCCVYLFLRITFVDDCVSDYWSLSCPCTQRNTEGLASSFYWNRDLRVDDLCPFTFFSSPEEIICTVTVWLNCIFFRSAGRIALCGKNWTCPGFRRKPT